MANRHTGPAWFVLLLLMWPQIGRAQEPSAAATSLGGTSWQLVKFQGGDDKVLTPADKTKYTIAFNREDSISVRIDCNRGHGTWKSSGPNQIEFGPLALTRAMCPPAPLNDRLPRDWENVRSYTLKDGHLFLSLMADAGTYEFEPMTPEQAQPSAISGLPATFVGTIPCADCPGIHYQVNLQPDHTFAARMTYEERNTSSDEHGRWRLENDGKTLVLQSAAGAPRVFTLRDAETLRVLSPGGKEIESKLNYDLRRAPEFIPIPPGRKASTSPLENTYWKLIRLGDSPVTAASLKQEPHFVLNSETHRVSGSGGCNRLVGSYQVTGDQLSFHQMAGTMMACLQGMDTEQAFLKALGQVKTWKASGSKLELFDSAGTLLASFEAREMK